MDTATIGLLLTAIQGPASAVVVSMVLLASFMQFLIKHVLPRQDAWIEKVMEEAKESRLTFERAVDVMAQRLAKVDDNVLIIGKNIKEVEKDVESIKRTISKKDKE
jgi:hypothetical protein